MTLIAAGVWAGIRRLDYSLLSKFTLKIHSLSSTLIFWEVTCFWEANLRGSVGNNCTERAQICSRFGKWSCVIRRMNTYLGIMMMKKEATKAMEEGSYLSSAY